MCNVSLGQHILYVFLWGIWLKKTNISSLPQIKLAGNPTGTVVYCILVSFAAVLSVGHISLPTIHSIPIVLAITALVPKSVTRASLQHYFPAEMPTKSLFLANKERSLAILSIASSNCNNLHHFPLKLELF